MKKLILTFVVLFGTSVMFAQSLPPAVFHSNLTSGPNTGGQNNAGAFVTIHGNGFGTTQGSSVVTIGGGDAASYQSWSNTSITFQLGSLAKTGNIVVIVGGVSSNSVPFTVRSGNIYFVSSSGNDSKTGSYTAPWKTVANAAKHMKAGDITYLENGYACATELTLSSSGTLSAPMAIVTYPNSAATIGSATGPATGISITASNWVLSGLTLRGVQTAVSFGAVTGMRLTDNDVSCPNATASGACIATNGGSSFAFLGNNIHNNGLATSTNLASYEAMYLLNTTGVEVGWNSLTNTLGCNAIGAHSSTGVQYSFSVHDNYIYETPCEAIALGTVNPSKGAVSVYNNIIQSSGTGPTPAGTSQGYEYAAIVVGGGSSVPVQVYNNTIYDAGGFGGGSAGAIRAFGAVNLTNNIFYLLGSEQYVSLDTTLSWVTGTNNLFNGAGNPLGIFSDSVVGNPMFVSLATNNFHLQAGSPAIDAGATVALATDYDGVPRPQGAAYDIGAYEFPETAGAGTLSASPASLSYGNVTVGQSATTTTVLSNTSSTASVTISQVNSNNNIFQPSGMSFPLTLSAGQSATLTVGFVPTAAGAQSGTITVASNASAPSMNIAVSGTATAAAAAAVSLSPTSLTFASQTVATTSTPQSVTLTNTGSAALSISGIVASGNFTETNTCGSSLAANASCTISVTFTPTAAGTLTGAISFTDNAAASPQQVSLSGTGAAAAPALTITSTSLPSGAVGTAYSTTLTAANGTAPYTWTDPACSGSCNTGMQFNSSGVLSGTPVNAGTSTFTFEVTDAKGNTATKQLSITITAVTPVVNLSATSLTFASQTVSTNSTPQSVTLTNTGTGSLSISGITVSGNFVETNTCGSSLAANTSCTISVTFTPTAVGTLTGTISFTDNAASSPQQISLSGTGLAAVGTTQPSAALAWTESSTVSGYNVYRSTQSGTGYTMLNSGLVATQSYTDSTVTAGQTYYYVVTSVNSSGVESAYSSQVTAAVPAT